jgi:NAD(P)-dependent dehydrogenase (short-subunit alcohol dehydrogenase family)
VTAGTLPVAVVTGAGRGIGREHALALAGRGYAVVVNDLGVGMHGEEPTESPAEEVVALIRQRGGTALVSTHDVSDWDAAGDLVATAVGQFGRLDVLINNAGILRDAVLFKLTAADFDDVIRVHLRGTAATVHHAAVHWRQRAKNGDPGGRLINTTSPTGLYGNVGQANYAAAKAGVIGLTLTASIELERYGVTANVLAPLAASRLLASVQASEAVATLDPAHVARVAVWLCGKAAGSITGRVFGVSGRRVYVAEGWNPGPAATLPEGSVDELDAIIPALVDNARPNTTMAASFSSP